MEYSSALFGVDGRSNSAAPEATRGQTLAAAFRALGVGDLVIMADDRWGPALGFTIGRVVSVKPKDAFAKPLSWTRRRPNKPRSTGLTDCAVGITGRLRARLYTPKANSFTLQHGLEILQ